MLPFAKSYVLKLVSKFLKQSLSKDWFYLSKWNVVAVYRFLGKDPMMNNSSIYKSIWKFQQFLIIMETFWAQTMHKIIGKKYQNWNVFDIVFP